MTEAEWLEAGGPAAKLEHLQGNASERKLRLFAVACCRRHQPMLTSELDGLLGVAERVADGTATSAARKLARRAALRADWHPDPDYAHRRGPAKKCVSLSLARRAYDAATGAARLSVYIDTLGRVASADRLQASVLRCAFGNPFRPVTPDPSWLTSAVVTLARTMYESRDFAPMPILADALEEAGCDDADILTHCRDPQTPHVRGCWVVDLALGKG